MIIADNHRTDLSNITLKPYLWISTKLIGCKVCQCIQSLSIAKPANVYKLACQCIQILSMYTKPPSPTGPNSIQWICLKRRYRQAPQLPAHISLLKQTHSLSIG